MDQDRIPFLVFGDGPRLPSGLARIARDLAARLYLAEDELGIRLIQVGVDPPDGWHWQGNWPFFGFQQQYQDMGRGPLELVLADLAKQFVELPIVLAVNDPSRVYDLVRFEGEGGDALLAEIWGYFPIDGENNQGMVGGPAGEAVRRVDRVLAYGKFGAQVLKRTLAAVPYRVSPNPADYAGLRYSGPPVQWLPHGIEPHTFHPGVPLDQADGFFQDWARQQQGTLKLGCVATNQPRKDLGLLVAAVRELEHRGYATSLWLHTDLLTKSWDLGQLIADFGLRKAGVLITTAELSDRHLAARYGWSDCTLAPGLGEGFGYPIVESLACGTPVVHGQYAGGVELVPDPRWLVSPVAWRIEGCYALKRPVFSPVDWAEAILGMYGQRNLGPFCSGSVAHLSWEHLWPRWRAWISSGLEARRGQR